MNLLDQSQPARGMQCDPDPSTLGPGIWRILQNVRCRKNTVFVRNGSSKICDSVPVGNASLRGYWSGYLNGAIRLIAAFRVSSATRLYSYDLNANTWSEITSSTSRFATDGQVQFAAAKTRSGESVTGLDILIAQNGTDSPVIWKVAANTCSPLVDPKAFSSVRQQPYFQNSVQMSVSSWNIPANTSASDKFNLTDSGDYLTMTVDTTCTPSQYTGFIANTFAKEINQSVAAMTLNGQLAILVMNASSTAAYDRITKVEVYDSAATTWKTIWDPTTAGNGTYVVRTLPGVTGYTNVRLFCYPANDLEGISITGVKFSCDNGPAAGSETSIIAYVGTTGNCLSSTRFASSIRNKASQAEGTATVTTLRDAPTFYNCQGSVLAAKVRIPIDGSVLCSYYTAFMTPYGFATADSNVLLYASVGGTDFGLVSTDGGTFVNLNRYDTYVTTCEPDYLYTAYDDQCRLMPTGPAITSANSRVFIGTGGDLWASALDDPMKWRGAVIVDAQGNVDETSSVYRAFQGEKITALNPLSGTIFGVSSILVWTLGNTYRITGSRASEIGSYVSVVGHRGTRHPYSISIMDGAVWFLDSENFVRYTNGGNDSDAPSRNRVNTRIEAGTLNPSGVDRVTGLASFDYYALFYPGTDTESGAADTTPKEGLIYDQVTGEWVLDRFPFDIAGAVTVDDGTTRRILGITEVGKVWELYKPGQLTENGSAVPFRMEAKELATQNFKTKFFGRMALLADAVEDTTWNTRRSFPNEGTTSDGTINMSVSTAMAWRYDQTSTGGFPGGTSVSCFPILYGSAPAGTRIRQLGIDVQDRSGGADVG